MNIYEYFKWLYSLERVNMKYDLTNITKMLKAIGNPHEKFRSIHIAGTNGKGATASFIASALMEQGIKTGLFTSPHILNFNERIRINGKTISNNYIRKFLDENIKLIKKIKPSFFEVNTAMAFKYFADNNVDTAVIECGLGGRLDSTNIISPDVSVITQIDMDHMQFLGNTLKAIAKEKLGIVKPDVKTIVSDNNPELNKLFHSSINKNELLYIDDISRIRITSKDSKKMDFSLKIGRNETVNFTSPLLGTYQARNISAAYFAVKECFKTNNITFAMQRYKKSFKNVK